jgi:6-phosphogluconolactonase
VLASADALADVAARRFVTAAGAAISARGEFVVALAGGSTPRSMYERLAEPQYSTSVDWPRVQVLWSDERCVTPESPKSNYAMAREALLDHVRVRRENVHRIHGEDDPAAEAIAYERVVRGVLKTPAGAPRRGSGTRIDLVLLGLGEDGHTASLFPDATVAGDGAHGTEASGGDARWVEAVFAKGPSMWRVTLTPVVINAAVEVVFIVAGGAKAAIARRVLEGPRVPHELPAQLIAPTNGRMRWLLDAAAAAALS